MEKYRFAPFDDSTQRPEGLQVLGRILRHKDQVGIFTGFDGASMPRALAARMVALSSTS